MVLCQWWLVQLGGNLNARPFEVDHAESARKHDGILDLALQSHFPSVLIAVSQIFGAIAAS